jgi:hypothetical protein
VMEKTRRRQRPMLTAAIRQAAKAGVHVVEAEIRADGSVSLKFGKADAENTNDTDRTDETSEQLRKLI